MVELGRVSLGDPGALLPTGFWAAVAVWLERPQVANKRLCGARTEARGSASLPRAHTEKGPQRGQGPGLEGLDAGEPGRASPDTEPELGPRAGREGDAPAAGLDSLWDRVSQSLVHDNPEMLAFLSGPALGSQPEAPQKLDLILRTVIPKASPHCPLTEPKKELVVQDVANGSVTFLPLEEDDEGNLDVKMSNVYQLQLHHSEGEWFISVLIFCPERWHSDGIVYPKPSWLGEELLAKLARWAVENRKSEFKSTLSLVSILRYSKMYQELKEKYRDMVWPEVTDPEKFVYEDVAIATYLLILWEEERAERGVTTKQSFVDLGCGNGLLVHILSNEGHPGRGIDVRRRKIWDMYGPQTQLEEGSIIPSDKTLFPGVDWLIGNHSDELTPWIPVIAARSSYTCRFFVLPCCFFDFLGRYCRRQSKKTQYREYLDFVLEVGLSCGFHMQEDCLRIPSTKRVCLIGKSRTYLPSAEVWMDEQRTRYIHSRQSHPQSLPGEEDAPTTPQAADDHNSHGTFDAGAECMPDSLAAEGRAAPGTGLWISGFCPREKAERVRNCAALPRDFIDQVVLQVANLLLDGKKLNTRRSEDGSLKTWNEGGSLSLAEVAAELKPETLQRLKRECGGLQTLLRNSHQVFEVLNGRVHIRDWRRELQKEKPPEAKRSLSAEVFKTRLCWFFAHHPDGCVLPAARCPFAHGPEELRRSQAPKKQRQAP
ncbi:probable tRNA (uracil-O(2)-)-methyltransferase isoform X2 [Phodopus roborovskii]|uniref:probable tRNA (uracil-O(2)-)-methyltransferase isoform X2 n=1 Tax=Phodopus roborovskii TaxID=109678 RepID=UPI0021E47453|nr:probable tRNA (uracil-O(2)-)-methyltransferase isoform X2 [Phodopus roborovskii]